jgi:hypothetical protein
MYVVIQWCTIWSGQVRPDTWTSRIRCTQSFSVRTEGAHDVDNVNTEWMFVKFNVCSQWENKTQ